MDARVVFGIGVALIIFAMYFLEKEIKRKEIFWLFSGLGVLFGIISVYTVAANKQNFDYYIAMAVLFVLIAVLYFEDEEVPKRAEQG
ncbi:hypothetical protein [Candidatus Pyrohabitans sp.]